MDAFYASVEQRDRPELRGKPVIVGGSAESRGVVSAASYEARKFGVHSAMPTAVARRLCPDAAYLPVRMEHYAAISRLIRTILESFTPLVEPLSLDEAFLDVRGCEQLFGPAPEIGRSIKRRIREETELVASVGIAPNKFLAKLASDVKKPDGFVVVESEHVTEFLTPLPIDRLWGVGGRAAQRFHDLGVFTIGQLAKLPEQVLIDHFGDSGQHFWQLAHGMDDRPVVPDSAAKSISNETTFARDIGDRDILRSWLLELTGQVVVRLRAVESRARTVELKLRSSDFRTHTRSATVSDSTDLTDTIWRTVADLFDHKMPDTILPARLIGVGVSGLLRRTPIQRHLFEESSRAKQHAADQASDGIRERFGNEAIRRAGVLDRGSVPPIAKNSKTA
jgi:DNA polymerase-4